MSFAFSRFLSIWLLVCGCALIGVGPLGAVSLSLMGERELLVLAPYDAGTEEREEERDTEGKEKENEDGKEKQRSVHGWSYGPLWDRNVYAVDRVIAGLAEGHERKDLRPPLA